MPEIFSNSKSSVGNRTFIENKDAGYPKAAFSIDDSLLHPTRCYPVEGSVFLSDLFSTKINCYASYVFYAESGKTYTILPDSGVGTGTIIGGVSEIVGDDSDHVFTVQITGVGAGGYQVGITLESSSNAIHSFSFDEAEDSSAAYCSVTGENGSFEGGALIKTNGFSGNKAQIYGSDGRFVFTPQNSINLPSEYTLEYRFNRETASQNQTIVQLRKTDGNEAVTTQFFNDGIYLYLDGVSINIAYTPAPWDHHAIVRTSDNVVKMYINGSLVLTGSQSTNLLIGTIFINHLAGNYYGFSIDNLILYDFAKYTDNFTPE
jgi:hypothetical protein